MWELITQTTQMTVFLTVTLVGLVLLVSGMIGGHDHDIDHDHDLSHDHGDVGHGEPTVSIFSLKVIGTFIMSFGGVGAMATYYGAEAMGASLTGASSGLVLGGLMYGFMRVLYGQQASSLVRTEQTIGQSGTVVTGIDSGSFGEVEVSIGDIRRTYLAQSADESTLPKGARVRVVANHGSRLVVERDGPRVVRQAV